MSARLHLDASSPRDARRTVAASLRWIADTLMDGPDDLATLDTLAEASDCLREAEKVIEAWKRVIEARHAAQRDLERVRQ